MSDAKTSTEPGATARKKSTTQRPPVPEPVGCLVHQLVRQFLDETTPSVNFWAWLQRSTDVEAIIRMELGQRAGGDVCDTCGAPMAPDLEDTWGVPPRAYCGACAFGGDRYDDGWGPPVLIYVSTGLDGQPIFRRADEIEDSGGASGEQ